MCTITPFLWFDTNAEEAMKFYTSIFAGSPKASREGRKDSKIISIKRYPDGPLEGAHEGLGGQGADRRV